MTIKVALAGEGKTDHGEQVWDGLSGNHLFNAGACQPLIRSCAEGLTLDFIVIPKHRWSGYFTYNRKRKPSRKSLPGHAMKAYVCCEIASGENCSVVAVFVDGDKHCRNEHQKTKAPHVVKKRVTEIREELKTGFNHSPKKDDIKTIRMVPMRMIECWLMADAGAFGKITGTNPTTQLKGKNLECLWGDKRDPDSDYPKNVLNRLLEGTRYSANRETYRLIAEEINIETLAEQCPISAKPFIDEAVAAFS